MARPLYRVQFDMDGVLADFGRGYRDLAASLGVTAPGMDAAKWDDLWDPKVWAEIRSSRYFWESLSPLVPTRTMERLGHLTLIHDCYFVTNRPGTDVKVQSERWLKAHCVPHPTVIVSGKKGEFAKAANITHAIDDKAGNAVFTAYHSPETASYLLDRPYNRFDQTVLGTKVQRIASVEEFLEAIA